MTETAGTPATGASRSTRIYGVVAAAWFLALCLIPDPRPLGAPEWAVGLVRSILGVSEPWARAAATVALRGLGLGILGVLLVQATRHLPRRLAVPLVLVAAPVAAVLAQWINYGYFPIFMQLQLGLISAVLGALLGLGLRRSRIALAAFLVLAVGALAWATATGIPDDEFEAARATVLHVLDGAEDVPRGDEGFERLLEKAFAYAEDNSHRTGSVLANRAAILALGFILGEERVAWVAGRPVEGEGVNGARALRQRITLRGRGDLSQHFWVSAALAVLADEDRSMAVGIVKEMKDATPGGSGFSFVDLMANRCGILFALAATRDADSAKAMQERIRSGARIEDFCPEIDGLPEGIDRDRFQSEFGGLGGRKTNEIVEEIRRRLATCEALR
jgi:hypothetical protein